MVVTIQGRKTKLALMEAGVELIKTEMQRQGVTPSELAKRAGIGRPYLYRVLEGSQHPTVDWLDKVLSCLGVQINVEITFQKN